MTKTNSTVCPCCHRALPKPRTKAAKSREEMTDAELFAYLKQIGVREDVRFFLRVASPLDENLRIEAETLLGELESRRSTKADADRLNRIRDRYRIPRLQADRRRWRAEQEARDAEYTAA